MDYFKFVKQAWMLREQGILSAHDQDLYFYLLHRCCALGWQNPFAQSTRVVCAVLRINRNALVRRRLHLQEQGLIRFAEGANAMQMAQYELCGLQGDIEPKTPSVQPRSFAPPSLTDVQRYATQRKGRVDPRKFYDYYAARQWASPRGRIYDWQAVYRAWEVKEVETKNNITIHSNGKDYGSFR